MTTPKRDFRSPQSTDIAAHLIDAAKFHGRRLLLYVDAIIIFDFDARASKLVLAIAGASEIRFVLAQTPSGTAGGSSKAGGPSATSGGR